MAKNYKPVYLKSDKDNSYTIYKLENGVMLSEWSMDDELSYLESRDKVYRDLALIILAIALGATLMFFLSL